MTRQWLGTMQKGLHCAPDASQLAALTAAPLTVFSLVGHPCLGLHCACCLRCLGATLLRSPGRAILHLLQCIADAGEAGC